MYSTALIESTFLALQAAQLGTWQLDESGFQADLATQQLLGIPAGCKLEHLYKEIDVKFQDHTRHVLRQALLITGPVDLTFENQRQEWIRMRGSSSQEGSGVVLRGIAEKVQPPIVDNDFLQPLFELLDQSSVGLALLDEHELTYRKVNTSYATFKGKTLAELLGKPLLVAMPELKGLGHEETLQQILDSGVALRVQEVEVPLPPGESRSPHYVDLTYQPQWNATLGRCNQILVIAIDVTGQVQMRKELEAQKAELELVIQSAPLTIARFMGPDLIISTINQAFIDTVGKGPDIVGKPLVQVMPELVSQPFLTQLEQVFKTQQTFEQTAAPTFIQKNGQLQLEYYNICFTPLIDINQNSYGVLGFAIDVSDQVRLRKRIEQTNQSLHNAVDLAKLGTWVIHTQEKVLSFSPAVSRWIGFTSALTFEQIRTLTRNVEALEAAYRSALSMKGERRLEVEFEIVNQQTQQSHILYALGNTHYDEQGRATHLRGFVQDVTAERKMQQLLEAKVEDRTRQLATSNENLQASNEELVQTNEYLSRSNESLEQFAYIASHDLQEPLRKIRQFSDLLVKYYQREQVLKEEYLDRIRHSANRMSELVSDLLAFSQISNAAPVLREIDLNEILRRVQETLSVSLEETKAEVTITSLPKVQGDALQLEQLWQNLLSNALKFSSKQKDGHAQMPIIRIDYKALTKDQLPAELTAKKRSYHQFSIQDNGVGFDEKYADRMFGVFQRLHDKSEFKGSGVGLSISQKVVQNHGGMIRAESKLGKGASFYIYLPA